MPTPAAAARTTVPLPSRTWRALLAMVVIAAGFSLAGITLAPSPAQAVPVTIDQCNGRNAGPAGATTGITCTVTVVNVINGGLRSSTVTVTRTCSLNPCLTGDLPGVLTSVTTSYSDIVDEITQCNDSGNDAAPPLITCTVTVTNNISADTPGAEPKTDATVNQCNNSATSGGPYAGMALLVCSPSPATTDPSTATVVQCNDSVTGGGSTADCAVATASEVSPAIPIRINQCNNSGIAGGTLLTCDVEVLTNIIPVAGTSTPTTSSGGGTGTSTTPQISRVPSGGVPAGAGAADGLSPSGLLALGTALLMAAMAAALLGWQRAARI